MDLDANFITPVQAFALTNLEFERLSVIQQDSALWNLFLYGETNVLATKDTAELRLCREYSERFINLCEPRFESVDLTIKVAFLKTLNNSAARLSFETQGDSAKTQMHYLLSRIVTAGESIFYELDADGRGYVLVALHDIATLSWVEDHYGIGFSQAKSLMNRVLRLGRPYFADLSMAGRDAYISCASTIESYRRTAKMPISANHAELLAWLKWAKDYKNLRIEKSRSFAWSHHHSIAELSTIQWLISGKSFPASPERLEQASMVRNLAQSQIAIAGQQSQLRGLHPAPNAKVVLPSISGKIATAHGWPICINGAAHWLLALLCAHAPDLLPAIIVGNGGGIGEEILTTDTWLPDIAAIARVLNFDGMRLDHDSFRAPYFWGTILPSPLLDSFRFVDTVENARTTSEWLDAWLNKNNGHVLSDALQLEWLQHVDAIQQLAVWLQMRGLPNPARHARDACLLGQADMAVAEALLAPQPDTPPHRSKLNNWINELAKVYGGHTDTEWDLARTLYRFSHGGLCLPDVTPSQAWDLLESGRIGQACRAHPKKQSWTHWDKEAVKQIHLAEVLALADAEQHIKARLAGNPLPMPDEVDSRIEPFATMAEQWQRMGVGLIFETPSSAGSLLHAGETLVQLWWDEMSADVAAAQGQALLLSNSVGGNNNRLSCIKIPPSLGGAALRGMALPWAAAFSTAGHCLADDVTDATNSDFDTLQAAWESMVAEGSAARRLIDFLRGCGSRLVLILPHRLANMPWQAFQETVAPGLTLELAASVGAWAQARRAFTAKQAPAENGSVLMAHPIWQDGGELEAREIAEKMGIQPTVTSDFTDVITALQAPGPVHLAIHGSFDVQVPQRSSFVVDMNPFTAAQPADKLARRRSMNPSARTALRLRKGPSIGGDTETAAEATAKEQAKQVTPLYATAQLPAWVLGQLQVKGDISLGTCDSLRIGVGGEATQTMGPSGIGAVLMAAGARSVVGSLWACDEWATAVFFAFWYDERQRNNAGTALQRARQRLRHLTNAQLLAWVSTVAPASLAKAKERCDTTATWSGPFAHPWCWATFSVLGNAPALPSLRTSLLPDQVALIDNNSWWSTFQQWIRQYVGTSKR